MKFKNKLLKTGIFIQNLSMKIIDYFIISTLFILKNNKQIFIKLENNSLLLYFLVK